MSKKCARPECGKTVYPIEELKCLDKVWHKQCFKCTVCGMTLNMKNYKGYDKMPYCEPHYPKTVASVVVDTPEMRRLAENTRLQSQVKYHEEFEKSRGQKIEVADDPEVIRHLRNTQVQSQVAYHGDIDKKRHQDEIRPAPEQQQPPSPNGQTSTLSAAAEPPSPHISSAATNAPVTAVPSPYSNRLASQSGTIIYSSEHGGRVPPQQRQVGSIADYDPLNGNWGSVGSSRTAEKIAGQNKNGQKVNTGNQVNAAAGKTSNQQVGGMNMGKRTSSTGLTVKALYDYTAADKDEVSFVEGDVIVNCQKVDEGWMTGTVQRTLKWGMLPANYVEVIKQPTGLHYLS
uniref:LIM and SH3 domain protein F42H10.3 n=1 Tax=Syphacia muris TaxID=451379 RepID=A0A0N5A861_9BILA